LGAQLAAAWAERRPNAKERVMKILKRLVGAAALLFGIIILGLILQDVAGLGNDAMNLIRLLALAVAAIYLALPLFRGRHQKA
jgi:hypothetical protein